MKEVQRSGMQCSGTGFMSRPALHMHCVALRMAYIPESSKILRCEIPKFDILNAKNAKLMVIWIAEIP